MLIWFFRRCIVQEGAILQKNFELCSALLPYYHSPFLKSEQFSHIHRNAEFTKWAEHLWSHSEVVCMSWVWKKLTPAQVRSDFFFACCLTYQIQMVPDKNGFCLFQTKIVFVLWSSTLYNLLTNLCPFPNNLDISGGFICKMNRFLYIGCNKCTSFAYKTTFTYPLVLYLYCFIKW